MTLEQGGRTNRHTGAQVPGRRRNWRIEFHLDPDSGVPAYLQIVHQVEDAIRLGRLVPNNQLPTVRDVVTSLNVNPNTVLKAYRELETRGLALGLPGEGTFIRATLGEVPVPEITALRPRLVGWVAVAEASGLDEKAIRALFADVLQEAREQREARQRRAQATVTSDPMAR